MYIIVQKALSTLFHNKFYHVSFSLSLHRTPVIFPDVKAAEMLIEPHKFRVLCGNSTSPNLYYTTQPSVG